ncbi:MAG: hypothetical protein QG587_2210, partial [Chloroflexota bacterium]|nr:hypothetical protein [Chloroflexota bacterium]
EAAPAPVAIDVAPADAPEVAAAVHEMAVDAPAELAPVDEQQPTPST